MGVLKEAFRDVNQLLEQNLDKINNVLILGDQNFNRDHFPNYVYAANYVTFMRGMFPTFVFKVLDIQGNVDLNYNLNDILTHDEKYDLIIDLGTSEHVDNQINYFTNINNLLNDKGYYYSNCIDYKKSIEYQEWIGHCFYYYSYEFFEFIQKPLGWKIVDFYITDNKESTHSLIFALMQKTGAKFDKKKLNKIYDHIDVVLEETDITKMNQSSLSNVKQILKSINYEK